MKSIYGGSGKEPEGVLLKQLQIAVMTLTGINSDRIKYPYFSTVEGEVDLAGRIAVVKQDLRKILK